MSTGRRFDTVIVGAGHGGAAAAAALRQAKVPGSIAIIGDESDLPYERPPLTKEYLSGEKSFERLLIRPASFWTERQVTTLLGVRIVGVDTGAHAVTTACGETIGYRRLIWATGGSPRRLTCSGHDLAGVHTVRNRADADRMIAELPGVDRVVVIGGGYIGLEVAAVLAKSGRRVVVLEAEHRVLARVAGETLSRFYEAEHRAHGVDIRTGATVDCILEASGSVSGVRLAGGEIIDSRMVIVGIGIEPAVKPLLDAGAEGGNGVRVDHRCRTSLADVFAIGDCALHVNRFADGASIRLESVQNANDQAGVVAKSIAGEEVSYDAVPWFWSNQYDLKLQTVGLSIDHDQVVTRGEPASRSFSIVYLRKGVVVALDCVNMIRDYVQGRQLVMARSVVDPKSLADHTVPLKQLV